jgi:peptidase A4-like protein/VCBS repeat protein
MRNYRAYGLCGLIGGFALFALGPAQMNTAPIVTHKANLVAPHIAHAPMIRAYGPGGQPLYGPHGESTSSNWSGYARSTGSTGNYTSASFHWTVQSASYVNYGAKNPFTFNDSSQWVGIGGFSTDDLIQLGSESYVASNGTPSYYVWYEVLPASETLLSGCTPSTLSSCPVSAGDAMTASLTCTANCTASDSSTKWTLSMTDSTKGWSWTGNFTYESCLCSVEWIEEAPTYSEIAAISNYGTAAFSNLTVNGGNPGLSLSADGIILHDPEGGYSTPCQAFDGNTVGNGNQFVIAYGQDCISTFHTHDFNDDAKSDIAWRNTDGDLAIWLMSGTTILSSPDLGNVSTTWSVVGQRDFNGDGYADLLWRNTDGDLAIWFMNGTTVTSSPDLGNVPTSWTVVGTGDFNGDGRGDILWRNSDGDLAIWLMNGTTVLSSPDLGNVPTSWMVVGTGDFNGDGMTDILWRNSDGDLAIWFMNGTTVTSSPDVGNVPTSWTVVGTGDFNGDGKTDILWRNSDGDLAIWLMNDTTVTSSPDLGNVPTSWTVVGTGDFNAAGMSDILWRNTDGDVAIWFMNGTTVLSSPDLGNVPTSWVVQGANAD